MVLWWYKINELYWQKFFNWKSQCFKNFKKILGPYPADSAFTNYKNNSLFISTYHDQALIPFKLVNKKGYNLTLGLNYRRLSPAHGTAKNLKFKNKSNNSSYIACMLS